MAGASPSAAAAAVPTPAVLAKAALRRLAVAQQEPTPENFARAYAEESGRPLPAASAAPREGPPRDDGPAWGSLIERLVRGLERGGKQWTAARRKESVHRILDSSRSDAQRLAARLHSLLGAWEADRVAPELEVEAAAAEPPSTPACTPLDLPPSASSYSPSYAPPSLTQPASKSGDGLVIADPLAAALLRGLPSDDRRASELADELKRAMSRLRLERDGESAADRGVAPLQAVTKSIGEWLGHRRQWTDALVALCDQMTQALADIAEDDSWARGQCEQMREQMRSRLGAAPSIGALRAAGAMLSDTREHQRRLRGERQAARDHLKALLARMIDEVGAFGRQTGGWQDSMERHAVAVAEADSLESLAGVVQALLADSREMHRAVQGTLEGLQRGYAEAETLRRQVQGLEDELRRLSDEVATDALTQLANRRGLEKAFFTERERVGRSGGAAPLSIGLIDIDNFKKLNDRLGHAAGDMALKTLAAAVVQRLRPVDHVARFGGEEFVVLLPATPVEAAQQALTRLQRSLSASLFLHEGEEVFVTFSAGVTPWRPGESLEDALERADFALYEAKRSGKNRTCIG